ncbi:hypothetical protein HEP87_17870 [Streptomyces sp. S1D4-11]|nr:hypothetical protein [Streptomyces sp. S1D4-11]
MFGASLREITGRIRRQGSSRRSGCCRIPCRRVGPGIGIAVHQVTGWAPSDRSLAEEELFALLEPVRREREGAYWYGVAASANASSILNFVGDAKNSGGRIADALLHPDTEYGRRIRSW